MKKCTKCLKIKDDFYREKRNKDGLGSWCKDCNSKKHQKYVRTKVGLVVRIYADQRKSSKLRDHKMPTYTRNELQAWCFSQKTFHELYDNWDDSGYEKMMIPSVDRLDDYNGYSLNNIQLMTWQENFDKGNCDKKSGENNKINKSVIQYDMQNNFIREFYSIREAHRQTGIYHSSISSCCLRYAGYSHAGGFKWEFK